MPYEKKLGIDKETIRKLTEETRSGAFRGRPVKESGVGLLFDELRSQTADPLEALVTLHRVLGDPS